MCPECGAVFEEEGEEGTEVELADEEDNEEETLEEGEETEEKEVAEKAKANKKIFWAGLITLLIGSQGVSLGSLVHNTFHLFTSTPNKWNPGSAKVYGYLDQMAGFIGIILTLIGLFLVILYIKKQNEEEKYREELKENLKEGEEMPEEYQEPLLVRNKLFLWTGLILVFITGPVGVIMGLAGGKSVDNMGAYGLGSGALLTIIGIILLFLAIWQKKEEGEEESEEEEEYGEIEEESEEPEEEFEDMEEDLEEE